MVACGAQTLEYSYHRRLRPSQEPILSKVKYWEGERSELPLNVMVLVLDSTSAADAARHLPLTMNLLRSELNFIQFSKYHALGEPTMVNVQKKIPIFNTKVFRGFCNLGPAPSH